MSCHAEEAKDADRDVAVRIENIEMATKALTAKTIRSEYPGLRLARGTRRAHPGLRMCRHFVAGLAGWMLSS